MNGPRTMIAVGASAVMLLAAVTLVLFPMAGPSAAATVSSALLYLVPLLSAVPVWACALKGTRDARFDWSWALIALGLTLFGLAEAIEEVYFKQLLGIRLMPDLSIARLMYALAIPVMGAGLTMQAWKFRRYDGFVSTVVIASVVTLLFGAYAWYGLSDTLRTLPRGMELAMFVAYVALLIITLGLPAFALTLLVSSRATVGAMGRWITVSLGALCFFVATLTYIQQNAGTILETPNASPAELGWWIGCALIGVAASSTLDIRDAERAQDQARAA